jgi:hypothetical protein
MACRVNGAEAGHPELRGNDRAHEVTPKKENDCCRIPD